MTDARRRTEACEFLEAFALELRAAGVDVSRITTGVPILHPQIFSFSGLWQLGKGTTERLYRAEPGFAAMMAKSPIRIAYEGGGPVRYDLTAPPRAGEFAILGDLRRDGYTDYVVYAVPFADGSHKALSLATSRRGGFDARRTRSVRSDDSGSRLQSRSAGAAAHRAHLAGYLCRAAIRRPGARGPIERGTGETIRAVIWLCDLRGFTGLSETLPRETLIDLLNSYFGPMCDAVAEQGGEILKFIGDAMLAIFPIGSRCRGHLAAPRSPPRGARKQRSSRKTGAVKASACRASNTVWRCIVGDVIVWQYRQRHPARFHGDRAGGQSDRAHRIDVPATRPVAVVVGRFRQGRRHLRPTSLGAFPLKGVGAEQEIFVPRIG